MNIINIKDNSNKLFFIGGVVRDELLGRDSRDIDITYAGNAIEYCSKFGEVIQENPDFGTVRVRLDNPSPQPLSHKGRGKTTPSPQSSSSQEGGVVVDFASTRSESYPKKGHLPVVDKIGCSLKEDVLRRDFTINALAKSVMTGEIIDYTGGLKDLKNKKLRVLHDESFIDDPTRIVRGLKFSVRFGFELEEHTKRLQDKYLSHINYDISYKRLKKELMETFSLNSQIVFEKFINEKIYKLVTPKDAVLPDVNIEETILEIQSLLQRAKGREDRRAGYYRKVGSSEGKRVGNLHVKNLSPYSPILLFPSENLWLIYVGFLGDLSRLPLTKTEQKILDDVPKEKLNNDFELYKAFENASIESIMLYAVLKDKKGAMHYIKDLCDIKISVTGKNLQNLGIKPSPRYREIFDEVLKQKLKNPSMTCEDEIEFIKSLNKSH